jgi:outer membrane protein TolC
MVFRRIITNKQKTMRVKNRPTKIFLLLVLLCNTALAQQQEQLLPQQFLSIVKQYHPVAKAADIFIEQATAEKMIARGNFDPTLSNQLGDKNLVGQNYYNYLSPEVYIPTWYGVNITAGFDDLNGQNLNNSETQGVVSHLGVEIPLLKNLLFDKRRAAVQQAKVLQAMSYTEKRAEVNKLCIEAMYKYYNWTKAYNWLQLANTLVSVNDARYKLIKRAFELGERPAIDTTEALTQLIQYQQLQQNRIAEYAQATLAVSYYMWAPNGSIALLPTNVIPHSSWDAAITAQASAIQIDSLLAVANNFNPELILNQQKLQVLEIDKRAKQQDLLPKLNFNYNLLSKGYFNVENITKTGGISGNSAYALKFETPIQFLSGRGAYKVAKLKIKNNLLQQNLKQTSIEIKLRSYYFDYQNLYQQIVLATANVNNYNRLVRAEQIKLENGESSIFLINARENKALEAQEKLVELKAKFLTSIYILQGNAGLLD